MLRRSNDSNPIFGWDRFAGPPGPHNKPRNAHVASQFFRAGPEGYDFRKCVHALSIHKVSLHVNTHCIVWIARILHDDAGK